MAVVEHTLDPSPTRAEPAREAGSPDRRFEPAVGLLPLTIGLAVAGTVLAADDGLSVIEGVRAVVICAWALAGGVLVSHRVHRSLGLLLSAGAALAGLCALANGLVTSGVGGATEDASELVRAFTLGLVPSAGFHLVLALPSGALLSRARRTASGAGHALGATVGLAVWSVRPDVPRWPVLLLATGAFLVGTPAAHRAYAASRGVVRQRLQWLGLAIALVVEVALVVLALSVLVDWPDRVVETVVAATVLVPLAFLVWVTRRLVTRVDRVLAHTVSLTGLSMVVVAVYVAVILGLGRSPDDDERGLLLLSMLAAALSVAVFGPARERLAEVANRLVYGERTAPDEALETFGSRMTRALPLDELLLQLAESLHKSMALRASEVWTGSEGYLQRGASVPDRDGGHLHLGESELPVVARAGVSGPAWASVWLPSILEGRPAGAPVRIAPVTHSGDVLGLLVVERRPGDDEFGEEEERVLTELARQLGLALHNSQLDSALQATLDQVRRQADELQRSRARIVAAGDAERRKIERNLHDGAQQHLVALAVKLRLIEQVAEQDADAAKAMLEEARAEVQETVDELRTLAHGIYPPLLMDRGLPEALSAAASRAVLPATVDAEGIGRYPQDIEAAVYFCCLEALQNAGKHAGEDASVRIEVGERDGVLTFEVSDDGPGFDASSVSGGAGFVNMADRVGANGGTVQIDSAPGQGTRVSGQIPVPEPQPS